MTTLRVVLDPLPPGADPDVVQASRDLAAALVATSPSGCDVHAIVGSDGAADIEGVAGVDRLPLRASAVAGLWAIGQRAGAGDGLIHSASLSAPLVRHDRVHDHDQTVVTVWDLRPWEFPDELPAAEVRWAKAMLRRAHRHADAVVAPTHELARRLGEIAPFGDRIRVIAGAPTPGLRVPSDEIGRRRGLDLPEGYVLMSGSFAPSHGLIDAFAALVAAGRDTPAVVIDVPEGDEPAVTELAAAAGLAEGRVRVRPRLDAADRASVFGGAVAYLATEQGSGTPWRAIDALRLGVPTVATDTAVHREVLLDAAALAPAGDAEAMGAAVASALGSTDAVERLSVLAADRGRAFGWAGAAERVWQLHADL
ncbi:glycosyltransferase [Microbacterium sp.]|uniref:glycosyltransferase n=1 Tax=Microbacterium sp. TaxID=51671 RepID=UPI003734F041